jgi:diguanylate cyclase (GGDEF)-like protein
MTPRMVGRLLPSAVHLRAADRHLLRGGFALLAALLALAVLNAVTGLGGGRLADWLTGLVYMLAAAIVALRAIRGDGQRAAWGAFAIGLSLYGIGSVLWSAWIEHLRVVPIPSICDGFWLLLYPFCYAGIVLLARCSDENTVPAGVWLDGIIVGAGLAAVGAAVVLGRVLDAIAGGTLTMATELAYPVGDLLLAALVAGVLVLRGWELNRTWALLAVGFVMLAVFDCAYAIEIAGGAVRPSAIVNTGYLVALAPLAMAAWQGAVRATRHRMDGWSMLIIPGGATLTAFALLCVSYVHRINPIAFGCACLTLLTAILRMGITFRDVRNLSEVRRQAMTDDLTALPNRRMLRQTLTASVAAARLSDTSVTVLLLDLDRFKEVNDTLGHHAGDALLHQIGPRLQGVLRAGDIVARLGGDEFAVLLAGAGDQSGASAVCEKLQGVLSRPFEIEGFSLRIMASIGVATYPADAPDADELMKKADVAMYLAKSAHSGYAFYASDRDTNSRERLMLAGELEQEVHYQPKAPTGSRRVVGAEALVRWRRTDGTLLAPGAFVDTAEQAGLSTALTRRVLDLTLAQLRRWRAAGYTLEVAVNSTAADLIDDEFPARVIALLDAHAVPAHALILEVTERSVMTDPERVASVMTRLRAAGVQLSLDDFGTGYSSLTHLKSLPVDEVKIDRSFVARMCANPADAAIVQAMIALAHQLGMRVVAEGVEDERTWEALARLGCDLIQGYALGRPEPADAFARHLAVAAAA